MDKVYYNNILHFIDMYDGKIEWYNVHRDGDLPAIIFQSGTMYWLKNGKFHREGDEPTIIWNYGKKSWWKNDRYYRQFDLSDLYYFQFLVKFLFFLRKNKLLFHPDNLVGKLIKMDLYHLLTSLIFLLSDRLQLGCLFFTCE